MDPVKQIDTPTPDVSNVVITETPAPSYVPMSAPSYVPATSNVPATLRKYAGLIVLVAIGIVLLILIIVYVMKDNMTPTPALSYATPRFNADGTHVSGTYKRFPQLLGREPRHGIWTAQKHYIDADGLKNEEINVYSPVKSGNNPRIWETPYYPPQHLYRNTIQTISIIHPTSPGAGATPTSGAGVGTSPAKSFSRRDRNLMGSF